MACSRAALPRHLRNASGRTGGTPNASCLSAKEPVEPATWFARNCGRSLPRLGHLFQFAADAFGTKPAITGTTERTEQPLEVVLGPGWLAPRDWVIGRGVNGQECVEERPRSFVPVGRLIRFKFPVQFP